MVLFLLNHSGASGSCTTYFYASFSIIYGSAGFIAGMFLSCFFFIRCHQFGPNPLQYQDVFLLVFNQILRLVFFLSLPRIFRFPVRILHLLALTEPDGYANRA